MCEPQETLKYVHAFSHKSHVS